MVGICFLFPVRQLEPPGLVLQNFKSLIVSPFLKYFSDMITLCVGFSFPEDRRGGGHRLPLPQNLSPLLS